MGTSRAGIGADDVEVFLRRLGERVTQPATLLLIGGGALSLLGSPRRTLDIDYVGSDLPRADDSIATLIKELASELQIEVEGVPLDQFIPLPEGADTRHRIIGKYGNLSAYICDPYSIAISKLDRGFETDIQDIAFLALNGHISLDTLEHYANVALERASAYDLNPRAFREHLRALRLVLGQP